MPSVDTIAQEARRFVDKTLDLYVGNGPADTPELLAQLLVPADQYEFRTHFGDKGTPIGPEKMLEEVKQQLRPDDSIAIYAHVPICRYKCRYCSYYSIANAGQVDEYADLLLKELATFLHLYPWLARQKLTSLYFGGGTPTVFSPEAIKKLISGYARRFNTSQAEITLEGSPDTICENPFLVEAARDAGVNRFSFGVQTFDDLILEECGRGHTGAQAEQAMRIVQGYGFDEVVIDLMRGLPGQTLEGFIADIQRLIELGPDSIFVYRMRLGRQGELQTGFQTKGVENLVLSRLPDVIAMQYAANLVLTEYGYEQTSNVQWSRLDRAYGWDRWAERVPLFAFGWRAYSLFRFGEVYNSTDLKEWRRKVESGALTIEKATRFSREEEEVAWTCFNLRFGRLDAPLFARIFGKELKSSHIWPRIEQLNTIGMLWDEDDGSMEISPTGELVPEELIRFLGS